jgi:RNA polymerase sigma factor (sigma-70 family)
MNQETDGELIQACRQGDSQAWERLLDRYERLVFSIPLSYGLSVEDAADVAQITFTILMQGLDSLRDDTRLVYWLATVARRHTWRCLERKRRENVNQDVDVAEDELLGSGNDHFEQWDRLEWLKDGLNMLNQRCRELLLALYFDPEQPSYEQVSQRYHMPLGSIGPTRARCLEQLKKLLVGSISHQGESQ